MSIDRLAENVMPTKLFTFVSDLAGGALPNKQVGCINEFNFINKTLSYEKLAHVTPYGARITVASCAVQPLSAINLLANFWRQHGGCVRRLLSALLVSLPVLTAHAQSVQLMPEQVMTGNSSAFADGVWVRVTGLVGHPNCFYSPSNASLFYTKPNGVVDPKKALAMLMTAKLANRTVNIEFANNGAVADFWGYGISQCEIQRLIIN